MKFVESLNPSCFSPSLRSRNSTLGYVINHSSSMMIHQPAFLRGRSYCPLGGIRTCPDSCGNMSYWKQFRQMWNTVLRVKPLRVSVTSFGMSGTGQLLYHGGPSLKAGYKHFTGAALAWARRIVNTVYTMSWATVWAVLTRVVTHWYTYVNVFRPLRFVRLTDISHQVHFTVSTTAIAVKDQPPSIRWTSTQASSLW